MSSAKVQKTFSSPADFHFLDDGVVEIQTENVLARSLEIGCTNKDNS